MTQPLDQRLEHLESRVLKLEQKGYALKKLISKICEYFLLFLSITDKQSKSSNE